MEVVARSELEHLAKLQATVVDNSVVLLLVRVQVLQERLRLRRGGELGEDAKDLTTSDSADIDVVAKNRDVGGRDGERNLGECRVEGFDVDDSVLLVVETQGTQQTLNLNFCVRRPDTDVIAMLVSDARVLGVEFDVNAVAVGSLREELAGDSDRGGVRVLRVVNALRPSESTGGQLA